MGNCVFRGTCELNNSNRSAAETSSSSSSRTIKVTTANGGVMELFPPITAECITSEFPNHAIFATHQPEEEEEEEDPQPHPLLHTDQLRLGHSYFLLPINNPVPPASSSKRQPCATPYRMSLDSRRSQLRQRHEIKEKRWSSMSSDGSSGLPDMSSCSTTPRSIATRNGGVWKVKLVISPEQLSEILAQEATTEELVESLRTVAKCGGSTASASYKWPIS